MKLLTATDKNLLMEDDLVAVDRSLLLTPEQVKAVVYSQNEQKLQSQEYENQKVILEVAVNDLKAALHAEMSKQAPNLEEVSQRLANEKIQEAMK